MIHSLHTADRIAVAPWPAADRRADRLAGVMSAVGRCVRRWCGFGTLMPELRVSRRWLEEYERQSRKHSDGG